MPKQTKAIPQPTLFRRDVPQMPEGYYSSGPNPNLHRFVEEHATPYDPATDDYDVLPFDQPITTTKATAIYNMHTYWSKKPHDAIQQYIRHYTKPGDIVLDPFCGSGGTALAALMEGRAAIAIDLSPAATFITKNYCTPVDVDELQRTFAELQAKVKPEMDWLYETRCDRCDGQATTAYTVYSYVFQCPRCLTKLPLFDCPEVPAQTAAGKDKTIRICPHCKKNGHQEEIKTSSKRFEPVPVLISYLCDEGCKPKRAQRSHNDPDPKKRAYFEKYDLTKIVEIEKKKIPYWFPPHCMMNVESDTEPWGDEWRLGRNFRTVSDLYTKRNLWALSGIRHYIVESIPEETLQDKLLFALESILLINSKMCRAETTQTQNGTYYLPQIFKELYPLNSVESKTKVIGEAVSQIGLKATSAIISTQTATDLSPIFDGSIDYIFTDPPYAGNVQYGELNFIWEAWMNFNTRWHEQEIIVNETRGKNDLDWAFLMRSAMGECYRVLKPGRWVSLCYHDTSEGTWQFVQDLMAEIGFITEKTEAALFIDAGQKSYNQLVADKVTQRDLVINFRKPREGEIAAKVLLTGEEDPSSFSEKAQLILREALDRNPGTTVDRLYDELVSRMVRKGQFQRHNFDALLRTVAEETGGRWYLLETADKVDETENKKENAAAQKLEAFMHNYLKKNSGEIGVHYSNLFEEYLPIGDKPRRLLQDWLPEYFYKTEEGTWRPPANEDERQAKLNLRLSGELRHIKRFTNALSAGVPPAERDRPSNAATLAEWIYQCRRSGLYDVGRVLYERGGLRFDGLKEEQQLQVEEDYQICVKRGIQVESKPRKSKKKSQPSLFDENGQ